MVVDARSAVLLVYVLCCQLWRGYSPQRLTDGIHQGDCGGNGCRDFLMKSVTEYVGKEVDVYYGFMKLIYFSSQLFKV